MPDCKIRKIKRLMVNPCYTRKNNAVVAEGGAKGARASQLWKLRGRALRILYLKYSIVTVTTQIEQSLGNFQVLIAKQPPNFYLFPPPL